MTSQLISNYTGTTGRYSKIQTQCPCSCHTGLRGGGGTDPFILHPDTRLNRGQLRVPAALTPRKGAPGTYRTRDSVHILTMYLPNPHYTNMITPLLQFPRSDLPTPWAFLNRLTPNDPYMGRTAPLTSKRCILYSYSTNIGTEYFKHALYSPLFSLQNAVCFIMLTSLVHILFTFYIQSVLKFK